MKETERTGPCRHIYAGGRHCSHQRIQREPYCTYHRPAAPASPTPVRKPKAPDAIAPGARNS
jgi:hypothetical protein